MSYRDEIVALKRLQNHLGVMSMHADNPTYLQALHTCSDLLCLIEILEEEWIDEEIRQQGDSYLQQ